MHYMVHDEGGGVDDDGMGLPGIVVNHVMRVIMMSNDDGGCGMDRKANCRLAAGSDTNVW